MCQINNRINNLFINLNIFFSIYICICIIHRLTRSHNRYTRTACVQGISAKWEDNFVLAAKWCCGHFISWLLLLLSPFSIKSSLISQLFNRFLPYLQREKINLALRTKIESIELREQLKGPGILSSLLLLMLLLLFLILLSLWLQSWLTA